MNHKGNTGSVHALVSGIGSISYIEHCVAAARIYVASCACADMGLACVI